MQQHPSGVRPLGNALSEEGACHISRRRISLGALRELPDSLLVRILDTLAQSMPHDTAARCLSALSATSSYLHAFARDEDLWRRLVFDNFSPSRIASASHAATWREAYRMVSTQAKSAQLPFCTQHIGLPVYSDILFHKWRCLVSPIPSEWLSRDNVTRISAKSTSVDVFRDHFESPGIPVVITDAASTWSACKRWTPDSLAHRFPDTTFHAGGFDFNLKDYFRYCKNVGMRDDQPLYVFDHSFASKAPSLAAEYTVPEFFAEDMFRVLGENYRPDYRWLIAGPARSGSSFHKDPNATAAWNAVVFGEKKWVLFPPGRAPPGILPSGDEGDVTAPVSVMEWFLNFYEGNVLEDYGAVECVVKAGEIMFVPMGWWHCVLNTTTSIAITQNYVSRCNVGHVVTWLHQRPGQISGCRSSEQVAYIRDNFSRLVAKEYPELRVIFESKKRGEAACAPIPSKKTKRSLWDALRTSAIEGQQIGVDQVGDYGSSGDSHHPLFSFGF